MERRSPAVVCSIVSLVVLVLIGAPTSALEDQLHELRLPEIVLATTQEAAAEAEELSNPYPIEPVDQLPYHGVRHGFVTTTTGGLVFRVWDMRLPGRMPLEMSRIYDSKISDSLPPPPPGQEEEQRWDEDLGKNWIFAYSSYIVPIQFSSDLRMATPEGDVVKWNDQGDGTYLPLRAGAKHVILEEIDSVTMVETRTDGTKWTYTEGVFTGATHALTKIEDRSGNYIQLDYTDGYISQISNSDGSTVTITRPMWESDPGPYDMRVTKLADNTGREVTLSYDADGLLESVTDVLGKTWDYAYHATTDKLASATDPLQNEYLTASYDSQFRVSSYEANAGPWDLTYLLTTKFEDAFENEWVYGHDTVSGITTTITEPTGGTHIITLDGSFNPVQYRPPGAITDTMSWTYDAQDRPLTYSPPGVGSNTITYAYDTQENWVDTITGLDNGVTTFVRDSVGRVTEEIEPEGGKWTATYSSNGDMLTLTEPNGNVTGGSGHSWDFVCNNLGAVTEATDPTGREFELEYTARGDLWKIRRPDHRDGQSQLVYAERIYDRDAKGRVVSITDPLGNAWSRTYDDADRLTDVLSPDGSHMQYTYDARHRLLSKTQLDGVNDPTTTYAYDSAGRLTGKTMPDGTVWTYAYDDSGRLASRADPLSRTWSYGRDVAGRVTTVTFPGGQQLATTFDNVSGRMTQRTFPGGRVETFTYDATTGKLIEVSVSEDGGAWTARIEWDYDLIGRPTRIETVVDDGTGEQSRELAFTYDENGNRIFVASSPVGETITYAYDELNRMISTDSDVYEDWTVTYDPDSGHRTSVASGSRSKSWEYDARGRITREYWSWPEGGDGDLTYTLDSEGRRIMEVDAVADVTLQSYYDLLGLRTQLDRTEGQEPTETVTFSYDEVGRVLGRVWTDGEGKATTSKFEWDAAGRVTYGRVGDDIRLFAWDDNPTDPAAAMQITRSPVAPNDARVEISYGFDGRIRKTTAQRFDDTDPFTIASYRWTPLADDRAFEVTQRLEDDTLETRRMALDVGGYYAEMTTDFDDMNLLHPVLGVEEADLMRQFQRGDSMPNPVAPFQVGTWNPHPAPAHGVKIRTLSDQATAFDYARQVVDLSLAGDETPLLSLAFFDNLRETIPDITDSWTGREMLDWIRTMQPEASAVYGKGETIQTKLVISGGQWSQESMDVPGNPPCDPETGQCGVKAWSCDCGQYYTEIAMAGDSMCCSSPVFFGGGGAGYGPGIVCSFDFARVGYPEPQRGQDYSEGGVSLVNGDFVHEVTDMKVFDPGGEIEFKRVYRSGVVHRGDLGYKWISNWGEMILVGSDPEHPDECGEEVRWIKPDGSYVAFHVDSENNHTVTAPKDTLSNLKWESSTAFSIRHVSGTVRTFTKHANGFYPLSSLTQGTNVLSFYYDANERLEEIRSGTQPRLLFEYNTDGLLWKVKNGIDPDNDWVQYEYYDDSWAGSELKCGELATVTRPETDLYTNGSSAHPVTQYYYEQLNGGDCRNKSLANHLLTAIEVEQLNPLDGSKNGRQIVLRNRYDDAFRTQGQCFGDTRNCADENSVDVGYEYAVTGANRTATIIDYRLGEEVRELHEFSKQRLVKIVEDEGGLNRETLYEYNGDGLVEETTFADGSCEIVEYDYAAGSLVPTTIRQRPKDMCESDPEDISQDRLTVRTYEGYSGRVKTITGPEAYPDGVWDGPFNWDQANYIDPGPEDPDFRPHTTYYVYDFEEVHDCGVGAGSLQDQCDDWAITLQNKGFQCPWWCGNAGGEHETNGFASDDENWFGNLIKVYRYNPVGGDELATKNAYRSDGRLLHQLGPDGVKTEYSYYTDTAGAWDWRQGDSVEQVEDRGPMALKRLVPYPDDGTSLETRYAFSARNRLIATEDAQGVASEDDVAASGKILSTTICRRNGESSCSGATAERLRTTRFMYDLRGRQLAQEVEDSALGTVVARSWTTYDIFGQPLTTTIDPDTGVTPGAPTTNSTFLHLLSKVFYDDRGRVGETVTPEGRKTCFSYDSLNRLTETRKLSDETADCANGPFPASDVVISVTYDAMDRPVIETDPEGTSTYRWYDKYGRLEFVSDGTPDIDPDEEPEFEVYEHQWLSGQSPNIPPDFRWFGQTSYDEAGRSMRERFFGVADPGAPTNKGFMRVTWQEYDDLGRPTYSHVGVYGGSVPTDQAKSLTPPAPGSGFELATVGTTYDSEGKRYDTTDPEGRRTEFNYDGFGRLDTTILPATDGGHYDTVVMGFDIYGRPETTTSTIHDPEGNAHQRVSQVYYDEWGRTRRTTGDPGGEDLITEFEYDVLGRTTMQVRRWSDSPPALPTLDNEDRATKSRYDAAGRLWRQEVRENASQWATTELTHDGDSNVLSMTDAEGNRTDYEYDPALGRLERMLYPVEDAKRQTIEYAPYNLRGQPTKVQYREDNDDSSRRVTRDLDYDDYGRLTSRIASVENPHPTNPTDFFGTIEQHFEYDDLGNLVSARDYSPEFSGHQDIEVYFWYDSAGRRQKENQRLPLNDVLTDHFVHSTFDLSGFRTSLKFPNWNYEIEYVADARGRLNIINAPTDPSDPTSTPALLANYQFVGGQVWNRWYRNGTELTFKDGSDLLYDSLGRPKAMRTGHGNWGTELDFRYAYDRVGNLMYEQRRHEERVPENPPDPAEYRTRAYRTDLMGRLEEWAEGEMGDPMATTTDNPVSAVANHSDAESWTLDRVGNWELTTTGVDPQTADDYQVNELNQYTRIGADPDDPTFTHDWLGQLREDESSGQRFTWDLFGRLTEVWVDGDDTCNDNAPVGDPEGDTCDYDPNVPCPNGPSDCVHDALQARYRYDALNRRVEKHVPSTSILTDETTRYIYDGWRNIQEHGVLWDDVADVWYEEVRARYGHGLGLDEVLWMDRDVNMDPESDGIESRYFVHHDLLGSAVAISDDPTDPGTATIVERFTYSAYGEVSAWHNPTWNGSLYESYGQLSAKGLPFLYTGQRYDPVTGLHYLKNRTYDPKAGRFLRRDLVGYSDGPSVYQYADSNPSSRIDPLGLEVAPSNGTQSLIGGGSREFRLAWGAAMASDLGKEIYDYLHDKPAEELLVDIYVQTDEWMWDQADGAVGWAPADPAKDTDTNIFLNFERTGGAFELARTIVHELFHAKVRFDLDAGRAYAKHGYSYTDKEIEILMSDHAGHKNWIDLMVKRKLREQIRAFLDETQESLPSSSHFEVADPDKCPETAEPPCIIGEVYEPVVEFAPVSGAIMKRFFVGGMRLSFSRLDFRDMQGSRNHGARVETLGVGGVRSINGGGFQGMDKYYEKSMVPAFGTPTHKPY